MFPFSRVLRWQMPSTGPNRIALEICWFKECGGWSLICWFKECGQWSFHTPHTAHTVPTELERILPLVMRCPEPLILLDLPLQPQIPVAKHSFTLCLGTVSPLNFLPDVASGLPVEVPCYRPSQLPEGSQDPVLGWRRYSQVQCLFTSHLMVIYEF